MSRLSKLYEEMEQLEEIFSEVWELSSDLGICMNSLKNINANLDYFESDVQEWSDKNEVN